MPTESKREQVLQGVFALLETALPSADVKRNASKPESPGPGGTVRMRDGDPGEATVDLSPTSYNYEHRIPVEILAFKTGSGTRESALDTLMIAIGESVAADRTLGGLCDYLDVDRPAVSDIEATGAAAGLWAEAAIIAFYSTSNPLT